MTMFHSDVSLPRRRSRSAIHDAAFPAPSAESLSLSTKFLLQSMRSRLTVVTAAAEMLDPVSTGPESPSWTWGGTLRDEVTSLRQVVDHLEATLPDERKERHHVRLAHELTSSTLRLFRKFGLSGRSSSLPAAQDITVEVARPNIGTLFDMIWSAQVTSAESARQMKLTITKEGQTATVRVVSPIDERLTEDPIQQGALHCARLIAGNLGARLDMIVERNEEQPSRQIVSETIFTSVGAATGESK